MKYYNCYEKNYYVNSYFYYHTAITVKKIIDAKKIRFYQRVDDEVKKINKNAQYYYCLKLN